MPLPTGSQCPQERCITNRRATHRQWWRDPEWKALVKKETAGKCCEECGAREGDIRVNANGKSHVIHLTLDHPDRWAYASFETYIASTTPKKVVCNDCNRGFERGLKICPECKQRYCHWRSEMCRECYRKAHPELESEYAAGKEARRLDKNFRERQKRAKLAARNHPCQRRRPHQRCNLASVTVCAFTAKKAIICRKFKPKITEVV